MWRVLIAIVLVSTLTRAQAPLAFEVASVRQSPTLYVICWVCRATRPVNGSMNWSFVGFVVAVYALGWLLQDAFG